MVVFAISIAPAIAGCGGSRRVAALGIGPFETGDGLSFDRVLAAVQSAGYLPRELDPVRGRFEVVARNDLRGTTRFAVQCTSDGWIVVLPEGELVAREGARWVLPPRLAAEYEDLITALESEVSVSTP